MTAIVTRGDAGNLHLPDETVDLVVTSPPYFGLRSYQDGGEHYADQIGAEATPAEYLDALMACTAEWMRVLKPGGSIFVNLGDKYAGSGPGGTQNGIVGKLAPSGDHKRGRIAGGGKMPVTDIRAKSLMGMPWRYALRCIDELDLILRAEIVWSKVTAMPEGHIADRVHRAHEQVFHFVKEPRYFSAVDAIREEVSQSAHSQYLRRLPTASESGDYGKASGRNDGGRHSTGGFTSHPLGKMPGSVWPIPATPLKVPAHLEVDHFAAFPWTLAKRIILGWSPDAGVVLDPFGGSGTTALVASCLGRVGISNDLSADYCRLARWRTTDPGERARVLGVPKPEPIPEGQLGMFEGIGA